MKRCEHGFIINEEECPHCKESAMNQKATPLSSKERKHIETIKRRIDYLSLQLANKDNLAKSMRATNNMDYTRRELSALRWAVNKIEGKS